MSFALIFNLIILALFAIQANAAMPAKNFDSLAWFLSEDASASTKNEQRKKEDARGLPNISERVWGKWDLSADFLVWYASEEASAVWADSIKIGDNTSSFGVPDFKFNWDRGFRVGLGRNLAHDQWDTQLTWTWFRTEAHQTQTLHPKFFIIPSEFIHPEFFAGDLGARLSQSAKIRWTLIFDMFDWELGRNYWVSKSLSMRPFIGLKGGWIHQPIHVQYNDLIGSFLGIFSIPTTESGREKLKNNFWGVGPLGGVNTKWKLRDFGKHYPSLFGDFSLATLWGTWTYSDVYTDTTGAKVIVKQKRSTLGALTLRGFLGMGWDADFNKGKSHFAARLGYEMQLWLNQLRLPTSQLVVLHGDLTLQGLTLNGRLDF